MNKLILLSLIAFLFAPAAAAETLYERSFADMGYEPFLVEGAQKRGCQEVEFVFPEILTEGKVYRIVSVGLEIGPVQEGRLDANVSINGSLVSMLGLKDFKCSNGMCWERIFPPRKLVLQEENSLKICLGTGKAITSIILSDESSVGIYQTADFSDESAFTVYAEDPELVMGEKTTIHILLHNQGGDATFAEIQYARPVAEDKNAFSVVEGDNYFRGIVEAGQTVEITYVVKPRKAVPMTLPPAIVYYENEFGEVEQKFSNLVQLEAREPERKIEAFIVKEQETVFVGQPNQLQLAVKNVGNDPLYNLSVELDADIDITQTQTEIPGLMPKETAYLTFTANSAEAGKFPIGCTVTYLEQDIEESHCQNSFVEFKLQEISPIIYVAIAFIIIAVAIYIYIMRF